MHCQGRYDTDGFTHKPLRRASELTWQQMNSYARFPLEICVDLLWSFPHSRLVIRKVWCEASTHRGHLVGDEVALLRQHVGHHERGQLRVRVRVDEPVVWQRVAEVARGVVLHQVERGGLGVVGWGDGGDFVVLVPGSVTASRATAPSSAAPGLACVALRGGDRWRKVRVGWKRWIPGHRNCSKVKFCCVPPSYANIERAGLDQWCSVGPECPQR